MVWLVRHRGRSVRRVASVKVAVRMLSRRFLSRGGVCLAILLLCGCMGSAMAQLQIQRISAERPSAGQSYLLLVSPSTGSFNDFDEKKIDAINNSSFQGVAVELVGGYDTNKHTRAEFDEEVKLLRSKSTKDIWPWIFFNRFVGYEEGQRSYSALAKTDYFRKIKGIDVHNRTGALSDFYDILRNALDIAKSTGSPGIVIDPELYNDYSIAPIDHLADVLGEPPQQVAGELRGVGGQIMDIVNAKYPSAVLLFLTTGLTKTTLIGASYTNSFSYIVEGMLQRAKTLHSSAKIVSGGEITLGYCEESLSGLRENVAARRRAFAPVMQRYPNLYLGGTIAPWLDIKTRKGWMTNFRNCDVSTIKTLGDFDPLVDYLLSQYDFVWIYGASAGGYNAYEIPHQWTGSRR